MGHFALGRRSGAFLMHPKLAALDSPILGSPVQIGYMGSKLSRPPERDLLSGLYQLGNNVMGGTVKRRTLLAILDGRKIAPVKRSQE